jgi:hypothetical protein
MTQGRNEIIIGAPELDSLFLAFVFIKGAKDNFTVVLGHGRALIVKREIENMCFRKRGGLGKRQREKWGSVQHVAADTNTRRNKLIITWPSETERRGLRFLSCRCSFFFHNAKLNPPRAAKTGGGSDLLDLPLLLVLGYLSVTLAVCSIDRHSGSAARRQQK